MGIPIFGVPEFITAQLHQYKLKFNRIEDITKVATDTVAVYSDYAGDDRRCQYWTYAYYITDFERLGYLVDTLRAAKAKHGASGRSIAYKSRKDRFRRAALVDWFAAIRRHPGALLLVAYDKRFDRDPRVRASHAEVRREIKASGLDVDIDTGLRIIRSASFLPVIGHLLKGRHRLLWGTDWDPALDTEARRRAFMRFAGAYVSESLGHKLRGFQIAAPGRVTRRRERQLTDMHEEVLSIPDMLASSVAAVLRPDRKINCPDAQCQEILEQFARLPDPANVRTFIRQAHLSMLVFEQQQDSALPARLSRITFDDEDELADAAHGRNR